MQLNLSFARRAPKKSGGEEDKKLLERTKLCHTCEVKTVGVARMRALQGAAITGYEVEKVSQALEDVSAEKAEFLCCKWRGRVALVSCM
jgi:hypothetical protein